MKNWMNALDDGRFDLIPSGAETFTVSRSMAVVWSRFLLYLLPIYSVCIFDFYGERIRSSQTWSRSSNFAFCHEAIVTI